jgi:hypothetical protein
MEGGEEATLIGLRTIYCHPFSVFYILQFIMNGSTGISCDYNIFSIICAIDHVNAECCAIWSSYSY